MKNHTENETPWPEDLEIDPQNDKLATLDDSHPAKQVLILHAVCRRDCSGREIPWLDREDEAFDQEWMSCIDKRLWTFSGFIYSYVCFNLVLNEWINRPKFITPDEHYVLTNIPRLRSLLNECLAAAQAENNTRIIAILPKATAFIDEWECSILHRLKEDKLTT
jgi:hypothetical protein